MFTPLNTDRSIAGREKGSSGPLYHQFSKHVPRSQGSSAVLSKLDPLSQEVKLTPSQGSGARRLFTKEDGHPILFSCYWSVRSSQREILERIISDNGGSLVVTNDGSDFILCPSKFLAGIIPHSKPRYIMFNYIGDCVEAGELLDVKRYMLFQDSYNPQSITNSIHTDNQSQSQSQSPNQKQSQTQNQNQGRNQSPLKASQESKLKFEPVARKPLVVLPTLSQYNDPQHSTGETNKRSSPVSGHALPAQGVNQSEPIFISDSDYEDEYATKKPLKQQEEEEEVQDNTDYITSADSASNTDPEYDELFEDAKDLLQNDAEPERSLDAHSPKRRFSEVEMSNEHGRDDDTIQAASHSGTPQKKRQETNSMTPRNNDHLRESPEPNLQIADAPEESSLPHQEIRSTDTHTESHTDSQTVRPVSVALSPHLERSGSEKEGDTIVPASSPDIPVSLTRTADSELPEDVPREPSRASAVSSNLNISDEASQPPSSTAASTHIAFVQNSSQSRLGGSRPVRSNFTPSENYLLLLATTNKYCRCLPFDLICTSLSEILKNHTSHSIRRQFKNIRTNKLLLDNSLAQRFFSEDFSSQLNRLNAIFAQALVSYRLREVNQRGRNYNFGNIFKPSVNQLMGELPIQWDWNYKDTDKQILDTMFREQSIRPIDEDDMFNDDVNASTTADSNNMEHGGNNPKSNTASAALPEVPALAQERINSIDKESHGKSPTIEPPLSDAAEMSKPTDQGSSRPSEAPSNSPAISNSPPVEPADRLSAAPNSGIDLRPPSRVSSAVHSPSPEASSLGVTVKDVTPQPDAFISRFPSTRSDDGLTIEMSNSDADAAGHQGSPSLPDHPVISNRISERAKSADSEPSTKSNTVNSPTEAQLPNSNTSQIAVGDSVEAEAGQHVPESVATPVQNTRQDIRFLPPDRPSSYAKRDQSVSSSQGNLASSGLNMTPTEPRSEARSEARPETRPETRAQDSWQGHLPLPSISLVMPQYAAVHGITNGSGMVLGDPRFQDPRQVGPTSGVINDPVWTPHPHDQRYQTGLGPVTNERPTTAAAAAAATATGAAASSEMNPDPRALHRLSDPHAMASVNNVETSRFSRAVQNVSAAEADESNLSLGDLSHDSRKSGDASVISLANPNEPFFTSSPLRDHSERFKRLVIAGRQLSPEELEFCRIIDSRLQSRFEDFAAALSRLGRVFPNFAPYVVLLAIHRTTGKLDLAMDLLTSWRDGEDLVGRGIWPPGDDELLYNGNAMDGIRLMMKHGEDGVKARINYLRPVSAMH